MSIILLIFRHQKYLFHIRKYIALAPVSFWICTLGWSHLWNTVSTLFFISVNMVNDVANKNLDLFIKEFMPVIKKALASSFLATANAIVSRFTYNQLFPNWYWTAKKIITIKYFIRVILNLLSFMNLKKTMFFIYIESQLKLGISKLWLVW